MLISKKSSKRIKTHKIIKENRIIDDSCTGLDGQLINKETEHLQAGDDPRFTCNARPPNQQLSKSVTVSNGEKIEITNEKQDLSSCLSICDRPPGAMS